MYMPTLAVPDLPLIFTTYVEASGRLRLALLGDQGLMRSSFQPSMATELSDHAGLHDFVSELGKMCDQKAEGSL